MTALDLQWDAQGSGLVSGSGDLGFGVWGLGFRV